MSVAQLIESVQNLPDSEFLILRQAIFDQENERHLQFKPEKRVIYMDLHENMPDPILLSPEEEEKLRP